MSNLIKNGKKAFTVGIVVTTIMWSIGIFGIPVSFAATSGDLIKIKCTGANASTCVAVYYLGADGKRYVFPNEKTYKTWYSDFSSVKEISQTEMESYPIGGNATYKPGLKMVKITTDPKVYAVAKNGTLRHVKTEAIAVELYGATWNKQIDDVPDYFFVNYTVGTEVAAASDYNKTTETANATSINTDRNLTGGGPIPGGSTLTVALAADTPASGLVMGSAARVPFTTFTLTASSDGDVVVDSLIIERGSLAQDGAFSNLDLLDDATKLPINNLSKSLNSDHQATFGDDITVAAGTTKKVIIAANMTSGALSSYAGEVPTLAVKSITLKGTATLVGTLPIVGNYQTVNGTMTVGTAAIAVGTNTPSAATKEVGTKNYIVSSIRITNNSTAQNQDFEVKAITFTQNGSASTDDIENIKLMNTNTSETLGTVEKPTSKKISFTNLSLVVKKGDNVNLDLRVDIKSGSARTISLDVDQQSDVVIFDKLRSYNVLPSYTDASSVARTTSPFYNPADTTIGNGRLRIESIAITSTNIPENTKKVVLGKFKFVVEGEQMNITAMGWKFTTTTTGAAGGITNINSKKGDTQLTSAMSPTLNSNSVGALTSQSTATSTDTVSLPVGEHEVVVYGDLDSNFIAGDTVRTGVFPEAITVKGDTSGNTITPTPSGQVQSTSLTVKAAAVAVSLDSLPAAQSVAAGTPDYEFGRFVLDSTQSGSDIRVTQFAVVVKTTGSAAPSAVTGIELFDGANKIPTGAPTQACSGTSCSSTASNSTTTLTIVSGDLTVPKGTIKTISVKGDVGTGSTSGTFLTSIGCTTISAIDEQGQSVTDTCSGSDGSSMTLVAGGTLQISVATDPRSAAVVANTTVEVGKFLAKSKFEALELKGFGLSLQSPDGGVVGDADEIDTLEIWEQGGSAALGTVTVNASTATITPSVITLAKDAEKTFIVKAKWTQLVTGATAAASGGGVIVRLTYVDTVGAGSGASTGAGTITATGLDTNFNTFSGFKSLPTFAKGTVTDKITGNSVTIDIAKFSIQADARGPIALGKFTFGISTSTVSMTTNGYYLYESTASNVQGTLLTDTGDFQLVELADADVKVIIMARFDVNNDDSNARSTADKTDPLLVSAGTTRYFTLRGTTNTGHDSTGGNEAIVVGLAGDASFAGTAQLALGAIDGSIDQDDFIWSDLNFDQYSTSSATKTLGWFNGYRVPGLEDTTTTLSTVVD